MTPHPATLPTDGRRSIPPWYSTKGYKMRVTHFHPDERVLHIEGSAASLTVSAVGPRRDEDWNLHWHVYHGCGDAAGNVLIDNNDLRRCFGILDGVIANGLPVGQFRGVDAACGGAYIRSGDCLNVPVPAMGSPGDPCVSVQLDDEMRDFVQKLIASRPS